MWDLWWTKWRWGSFLRVLRFPLPIYIPPIAPQSPPSVIWGWYNRPVVAAVPSGLSLTPQIIIISHRLAAFLAFSTQILLTDSFFQGSAQHARNLYKQKHNKLGISLCPLKRLTFIIGNVIFVISLYSHEQLQFSDNHKFLINRDSVRERIEIKLTTRLLGIPKLT
jgi:hypothetical protein